MTTIDIYCRSATEEPETRTRLERQEAECRVYCQEHKLDIGMVHHEIASGATFEREHLNLVRSRYRNQLIQGVVVTYAHRLARTTDTLIALLEEMKAYQAALHCVNENFADNAVFLFFSIQKEVK
jgi:DNA invertase Pin-like site-specific DNA recombinase